MRVFLFIIEIVSIYYAFIVGIFNALSLLTKLSSENQQLSLLCKEEALINSQELHNHGISTSAYLFLELVEENPEAMLQSHVNCGFNRFIAATVVIVNAVFPILLYLSFKILNNETSVEIFIMIALLIIIVRAVLDAMLMMRTKSTFNKIAKNLYLIAKVEIP